MKIRISIQAILCLITICLLTVPGYSQVKDWDDVSREELEMHVYPSDSSAAAVILFDRAEIDFNDDLEYRMERHVRLKIIREEGYSWATAELFYNEEADQDIRKIRGHTFVLNNKGKIEKHKLDGDDIFEEETDDNITRVKFTLPSLKPGAVVEFKYLMEIGSPYFLPDWEFQKSIPVAWSEYQVHIPDWFAYNKLFVGLHGLDINESELFNRRLNYTVKRRRSANGYTISSTNFQNASYDMNGTKYRWVMKDLPAVKKLPFMTSIKDYKSKLWIQLTEINIPNQLPEHFLKSWDSVAEELMKTNKFGRQLKSRSGVGAASKQLTAGKRDDVQKMHAIYDFMVESMVWDSNYSIFAEQDIDEALKAKKGSGAELNLLLVQMLREAGLEANPVLLSTRNHGKVIEYFAIANQFNHIICKVDVDGTTYLLDATSENNFTDLLPVNDLNNNGLVITKNGTSWVELNAPEHTQNKIVVNANISDEGTLDGKAYVISEGYDAYKNQPGATEAEQRVSIEKSLFSDFIQAKIDSFQLDRKNARISDFNFDITFSELKTTDTQQSGDYIYFNPMLFLREEENPFPQPERTIPVDYPYAYSKQYVANFTIPDGYVVEEMPKTMRVSIPGGAVELQRLTQIFGNRISLVSNLSVKRTSFKPEEYDFLRGFYQVVVDAHNEQIVLKAESVTEESKEEK